jgi:HTH-type transcriptional regulator / antitoxin HigA
MSKTARTEYGPDYMSPPGETLKETLELAGISQAGLAERTGRPKKTINEIIQGKASITPETALQLEKVLHVSAEFWNEREAKYRSWLARNNDDKRLQDEIWLLSKVPWKEMVNHRWIPQCESKTSQVREILKFFGVASSERIRYIEEIAFRESPAYKSDPWALAAWLRKGELAAFQMKCPPYDSDKFLSTLKDIRALTDSRPEKFVPALISKCLSAGVAVVFIQELPKVRVSGATRWLDQSRPMMQMGLRHKKNDHIWFTFFHEAGHLLLNHAKKEIFLEDTHEDSTDLREQQANSFAKEFLIPQVELDSFVAKGDFTLKAIGAFAKAQGIAPGIVVGRLQYDRNVSFNHGNDLKISFCWEAWPKVEIPTT